MEDREIIKALEVWLKKICDSYQTSLDLGEVAISIDTEEYMCLLRGTLDLINHLQAENERLSTLAELCNTRANDYRVMRDRALKAEAENERLEDDNKFLQDNRWKELSFVKAEAYKEFAERLKEQKYQSSDWSHGEHPFVVEESDIDNTLYELVGE